MPRPVRRSQTEQALSINLPIKGTNNAVRENVVNKIWYELVEPRLSPPPTAANNLVGTDGLPRRKDKYPPGRKLATKAYSQYYEAKGIKNFVMVTRLLNGDPHNPKSYSVYNVTIEPKNKAYTRGGKGIVSDFQARPHKEKSKEIAGAIIGKYLAQNETTDVVTHQNA